MLNLSIVQMRYIVALNTYQSFALAAQNCYVTQPTLSMQIKKAEDDLQVMLFDRGKKPIVPTDVGKKVIQQAQMCLREVDRIEAIVKDYKNEISGTLRIGIIPTLSPYLLPLFIADFMEKYPSLEVIVEERQTKEVVNRLQHDLLDVGILVTPVKNENLNELPLFYEPFIAYVSKQHPLTTRDSVRLADLNINHILLLNEGHCFRTQVLNICAERKSAEYKPRLQFESGSLETLMRMVERGLGFTLLPELATVDMEDTKRQWLKAFDAPTPIREVSLVTHKGFVKQKVIELLQDEILQHLPDTLKDANGQLIQWT